MRKMSILLILCVLFISIPFSVTAEAPATTDWPYEAGIDYIKGKVLLRTDYVLDLAPYETEGPFDFYGISAVSVEFIIDFQDAEDFFETYGFCLYVVYLDPSVTVKDATEILTATGEFVYAQPDWCVYIDGEEPPRWRKGDINRDGAVDSFDCLKVKGQYFGTATLTDLQLERADINGDGEIDMFDYLEVKKIYFEQ